jgi:hypothetical protein
LGLLFQHLYLIALTHGRRINADRTGRTNGRKSPMIVTSDEALADAGDRFPPSIAVVFVVATCTIA